MDRIRAIQELVDQNKDQMPTGVATSIMAECQKAYKEEPKLYKLTWIKVDSHAHVEPGECDDRATGTAVVQLSNKKQTLIVEAVDEKPVHPSNGGQKMNCVEMPDYGMMIKSWLTLSLPYPMMCGEDSVVVIHSIVPYEPRKRMRVVGRA